MQENWMLLKNAFLDYSGGSYVWVLYAISLCYLAVFAGKKGRALIVWPTAIAAVTLFNPLLVRFVGEKLGVLNRMPRLFWFLMYYIVIGYACVHLIARLKKSRMQTAAFLAALCLIILLGKPVFTEQTGFPYRLPDNAEFADGDVRALSRIYHSEGIAEPKVLYGSSLMQSVRTYDPSVRSEASRQLTVALEQYGYVRDYIKDHSDMLTITEVFFLEDYSIPGETFMTALRSRSIDYVTCAKESGQDEYVKQCGMRLIGESANYHVYKVEG